MNVAAPASTAVTKRDLVDQNIDKVSSAGAATVAVSAIAGGISFASALEVMEVAKMMAMAGTAVPKHLRGNAGTCLAIVFQAVEWRMSPFAVANKSYEVNDRIAYESQLIHAVVEARAPLQQRLRCEYLGEKGTPNRVCVVLGTFVGEDAPHEYESPAIKDIKVKNSPLWVADPDQQLFYYASRAWARKWCPDVLMGIYTRDELLENVTLGREEEPPPQGLLDRLAAAAPNGEGFVDGHADRELTQVANGSHTIEAKAQEVQPADGGQDQPAQNQPTDTSQPAAGRRTTGARKAAGKPSSASTRAASKGRATTLERGKPASRAEAKRIADRAEASSKAPAPTKATTPATPPPEPAAPASLDQVKTAAEYIAYAKAWIGRSRTYRSACDQFSEEREDRIRLGVPVKESIALQNAIDDKYAG